LGELYGTSAVVRGNPELRPEQGITADVGLTAQAGGGIARGYAQIVGFGRWAADLIGYRRSSFSVIRPYNVASARVLGIETAAGGVLWGVLAAAVAVTALDPRDVSDDRQVESDLLPFRSRLVVAPELGVSAPNGWPALSISRVALTTRYLYRSSRVADPAGLIVLAEQSQLDLELEVGLHDEMLRLRGRLQNLLDQRSSDLVGYPLPGRTAHLAMEVWY
jgi:iron complex outermembrane receptor protein